MTDLIQPSSSSQLVPAGDKAAISHLKEAIGSGQHWYTALLEAIRLWESTEETYNGRTYCYLIAGEAFDWLLLAERLCDTVDKQIPDDEKDSLLFHGEPPLDLPIDEFKEYIGDIKFHQYLNYFYGITVEEGLALAVHEEVRKETWIAGYHKEMDIDNEAYRRIYGKSKTVMLRHFRDEKGYPQLKSISLTQLKEFTYWLFKYRFKHSDKARVASDTKKALNWLSSHGSMKRQAEYYPQLKLIDILSYTASTPQ